MHILEEQTLIIDTESKSLVKTIKRFNIGLFWINIVISFIIAFNVGAIIQEQKNLVNKIDSNSYSYLSDDDVEDDDVYHAKYTEPKRHFSSTSLTLILCLFASYFQFILNKVLIKHFTNVGEIKQMKKIDYINNKPN